MHMNFHIVLVLHWKAFGQGQHTEAQNKFSEFLKSVQKKEV